jgi:hypothetical protein
MANGLAPAHHQTHGRTAATEDMRSKTAGRLAWTSLLEVALTGDHLSTSIDRRHHHLQADEDHHGVVTERMGDTPTSHHHLAKAVIRFQTCLATVLTEVTAGEVVEVAEVTVATARLLAMFTFQATTTLHDDHASRMRGNGGAHETLATQETDITATGQTEAGATGTGTASEVVIRGTLAGRGGKGDQRDRAVQNDGIGIVTGATTTSTGGARLYRSGRCRRVLSIHGV